jgi:beta-glucosidase
LVLNNGRPLAIPWADEHIQQLLKAWQLGTQSGIIAQVIVMTILVKKIT